MLLDNRWPTLVSFTLTSRTAPSHPRSHGTNCESCSPRLRAGPSLRHDADVGCGSAVGRRFAPSSGGAFIAAPPHRNAVTVRSRPGQEWSQGRSRLSARPIALTGGSCSRRRRRTGAGRRSRPGEFSIASHRATSRQRSLSQPVRNEQPEAEVAQLAERDRAVHRLCELDAEPECSSGL